MEKLAQPRHESHRISEVRNFAFDTKSNSHAHFNGFTRAFDRRPACSTTVDTATDTANHPSTTRDTPQASETALHLHTAHHAVRWQLFHTSHHEPTTSIQERKRHTECATMESQLAEAAERGGR